MFNIHKKIVVLVCLYLISQQIKAQAPGGLPNQAPGSAAIQSQTSKRVLPNLKDYSWYVAELEKRGFHPQRFRASAQRSIAPVNSNRVIMLPYKTKEELRQQLIQRYPGLQKSSSTMASGLAMQAPRQAVLSASNKPVLAPGYMEQARAALEKVKARSLQHPVATP